MEILKYRNIYADLFEHIKPIYVLAQQEISGKIPRNGFLRDYAYKNIHEYFAVATENYFERNAEMKDKCHELYLKMKKFYNPDESKFN
jgi:Mlc titration factor MtfA (ptsG expression regulator)